MRVLFSFFSIFIFITNTHAQNITTDTLPKKSFDKKNIAKIDLVSPAFRTFQLQIERVRNESNSVAFSLLYTDQTDAITNAAYLYRLAATLEHRYYMSKSDAPQGFYLSSFLRYQWMQTEDWLYNYLFDGTGSYVGVGTYEKRTLNTGGLGVNLGYQSIFKDKIAIDAYFGPVYNTGDKRVNTSNPYNYRPNESFKPYVGYFVRAGISIGYVF